MNNTPDRISVVGLRDAFERSGLTRAEVAARVGWYRANGKPDSTRVAVQLGLKSNISHGKQYYAKTVDYDTAVALCQAIGAWPVDVGV